MKSSQLHVTPLGLLIAGYLRRQVPELVDAQFTAQMERDLDRIAEGALTRTQYLDLVWKGKLAPAIERVGRASPRLQLPQLEAVFEVRAGQVSVRAQGRSVPPPEGLLPEDLTEKDALNGTFKGKRTKREASTKGTTPRKTRRTAGSSGRASARKGARGP